MLKTNPVGLDISDRTIEVVALSDEGGEAKIVGMSRALLPRGVVERGRIKNAQKLAEALDAVVKNARPEPITPKRITFGIPEGQMYTRVFELAEHKREDRDMLVEAEMEASIPLRKDEALYTYTTLYETPLLTGIILVAVSKAVLNEWQALFRQAGFEVDMYESETVAAARGIFRDRLQSPACIVDMGAAATTVSIFSKHGLRYLQTLADAGDAMTLALSRELNIPPRDAEQLKIKKGLSDREDKAFFIIAKALQAVTGRVKAGIEYFQERTGERVDRVVLIGGSAKLKGVKEYYEENLGMSVWLGESVLLRNQGFLEYIEAAGLALRGLYSKKYITDPAFLGDAGDNGEEAAATEENAAPAARQAAGHEEEQPIIIAPVQFIREPASRRQQMALLVILVAGIGGVFSADWLRARWENAVSPPALALRETGIQIFNETIPLTVSADAGASGGAAGEIFETEITTSSGYADAVARGRAEATTAANRRSKTVWQDPIRQPADIGKITFPLRIPWLLYSHDDIANRLMERVVQATGTDVRGLSPFVTVLNITPTADAAVFTVSGRIRIKTDSFIAVKGGGAPPPPAAGGGGMARVTIIPTDTGWVNTRKGPGTSYERVTRVHPGEKYVLLEEKEEWYHIDLGGEGGLTAWIHSEYARKE